MIESKTTRVAPFQDARGKLGFGCMRLPKLEDGSIDIATFTQMVDAFLDGGLNYFDTARPYHSGGSEPALAQALADGCLLITDVPATVSPAAGSVATDEVLDAVAAFRRGFSEEFLSQVVSFSAASPDSVTCTLKNGVEILLGSPTDIAAKETVVTRTLEQHPGAVTYINVRVVTDPAVRPTVRLVDSDNVEAGDGVSASVPDEGQAAADAAQGSADAQGSDDASQGEGSDGEGSQDASQGSDDGSADGGGDLEGSVDTTAEGDA